MLHGWFTEPSPFFDGALGEKDVETALAAALGPIYQALSPPCVTVRAEGSETLTLTLTLTLTPAFRSGVRF